MEYHLHFSYRGKPNRLDKILSTLPLKLSRSQIQKHCVLLQVNQKEVKQSLHVFARDEIRVVFTNDYFKLHQKKTSINIDVKSPELIKMIQQIERSILYQDKNLCVLNKMRGSVIHSGAGLRGPTIAQAVFHLLTSYRETDALEDRAGIIHRLDKDTSGVLLVAKTAQAHDFYCVQFAKRTIKKIYISVVKGIPKEQQSIVHTYLTRSYKNRKKFVNIDYKKTHLIKETLGKEAISEYKVLYSNDKYSVVLWNIKTGRTHQIRLHAQYIGTPIIGDSLYSRALSDPKLVLCPLMLHALKIVTPLYSGDMNDLSDKKEFSAPIPKDMQDIFAYLGFKYHNNVQLNF